MTRTKQMKRKPGLWTSLEALPTAAAVLAEWRRELGDEFDATRVFLDPNGEQSASHPCTNRFPCECRHRVVMHAPDRLTAVCECDDGGCEPIELQPIDVLVWAVDVVKLGDAVRRALKFQSPVGSANGGQSTRIAARGAAKLPVFLHLPQDVAALADESEQLVASVGGPFILLTPTEAHHSKTVGAMQVRHGFLLLGLSRWLVVSGAGAFALKEPIDDVLAAFDQRLASGPGLLKTVERIDRHMELVAKQKLELSAAKARIEQMHGDGLFAFAAKIDREARDLFLAILASGDVAKASRDLDMKDSTLRTKVAAWRKRGKAYVALAEFVRWRKAIKGQAGVEFAKRLASGAERDVDFPSLIRDAVEELEMLDPENWETRCSNLADALRAAVS